MTVVSGKACYGRSWFGSQCGLRFDAGEAGRVVPPNGECGFLGLVDVPTLFWAEI